MVTKMAENSAKVEFQNVSFWYSTKQILFDISLKIVPNKITALIGPSGCGKSTLLRAINRMNDLIQIARIEGKVLYDNKPVYAKEVDVVNLRRSIGMVFQKSNPFPLSIFDNVAYGLRLQHIKDKKKIEAVVMESLQKADLWEEVKDRLQLSAFRLSGGQQQRLCIARALAIHPDVLLLDEPCSALDPLATAKIEHLLRKLKEETTMVIVTHNMHQAKRVSDATVFLLGGKIIEEGPTSQLFGAPCHKLTKEYIAGEFG